MDFEELAREVISLQTAKHFITYRELQKRLNEKAGRVLRNDELTEIFMLASDISKDDRYGVDGLG